MAFKVQSAMVDVINKSAVVVIQNEGVPNGGFVQIQFPFDPPPSEAQERDRVIATAKQFAQTALNSI